ncbi:MAG: hypothetical protein HEP71_07465 [Roseivirga sp.]|nr:hypothetical protein [Roseivirga sp.]
MEIISHIAIGIPLLPATLGARNWKFFNSDARTFTLLTWFIFINGIAAYLVERLIGSNMPLFHLYILVETVTLLYILKRLLQPFFPSKISNTTLISFVLLWLFNVSFGDGISGYPTYILAVKAALLIIFSAGWFVKVQKEKTVQHPERLFAFWLSTGVLIYSSGNMLLFTFSNYIFVQRKYVFVAIWDVHAILVILLYLIYTIALIWARKNPTSS